MRESADPGELNWLCAPGSPPATLPNLFPNRKTPSGVDKREVSPWAKSPQGQENDAWMKQEGPVPFLYPQFLAEPASIQCRLKENRYSWRSGGVGVDPG